MSSWLQSLSYMTNLETNSIEMRRIVATQSDATTVRDRRSSSQGDDAGGDALGFPARRKGAGTPLMFETKATATQSVMNLINCILGAGVLGYPYCFKSCGLVLATCIMFVSWLACRFSYHLLLYCCQISNKRSYEELAEQAFGKVGRQVVETCTAALNLGAVVAYLNILADVLSSVAGTIIPPGAEPSRNAYIAGVTIFGALPVALIVRDHSIVAAFSMASVGFVFLFAIVVMMFSFAPNSSPGDIVLWQPNGLLVAFPVMAYGFTAHPYYLGIYSMLQSGNFKRMTGVTDMAMAFCALVYWVVGIGGYVSFRQQTAGDVLRNLGSVSVSGLRGAYERAMKLCYGMAILGSIPLVIMPFYNILLPLLGADEAMEDVPEDSGPSTPQMATNPTTPLRGADAGRRHYHDPHLPGTESPLDSTPNMGQHLLVCTLVLGLAMASALWVPNVEFIFGLTGATASVVIAYIMPAMLFIRATGHALDPTPSKATMYNTGDESSTSWRWRRRMAVALLLFGIVSGITCTDAILSAVSEEKAVVLLAQELAAHEAVVVETANAEQKAKEAATAVSAVQSAVQELGNAQAHTVRSREHMASAVSALDALSQAPNVTGVWDIAGQLQQHQQYTEEVKVLREVVAALTEVRVDVRRKQAAVMEVRGQLDDAMQRIKNDSAAATAAAATAAATVEPGETTPALLDPQSATVLPAQQGVAGVAVNGSGAVAAALKEELPEQRAAQLAKELNKARGTYQNKKANATAGRTLEAVRSSVVAALSALNHSADVLDNSITALEAARKGGFKRDTNVKAVAVAAVHRALNATAGSDAALEGTTRALNAAASEETSELIGMLTQVAQKLGSTGAQGQTAAANAKELEEELFKDVGDSWQHYDDSSIDGAASEPDAKAKGAKSGADAAATDLPGRGHAVTGNDGASKAAGSTGKAAAGSGSAVSAAEGRGSGAGAKGAEVAVKPVDLSEEQMAKVRDIVQHIVTLLSAGGDNVSESERDTLTSALAAAVPWTPEARAQVARDARQRHASADKRTASTVQQIISGVGISSPPPPTPAAAAAGSTSTSTSGGAAGATSATAATAAAAASAIAASASGAARAAVAGAAAATGSKPRSGKAAEQAAEQTVGQGPPPPSPQTSSDNLQGAGLGTAGGSKETGLGGMANSATAGAATTRTSGSAGDSKAAAGKSPGAVTGSGSGSSSSSAVADIGSVNGDKIGDSMHGDSNG